MVRKCSHCGNIGHNSRTCINHRGGNNVNASNTSTVAGVRLFGVQLLDISSSTTTSSNFAMKKSFSMDCLLASSPFGVAASSSPSPSSSLSSSRVSSINENTDKISIGYLSDGLFGSPQDRKKGLPWTEEEHRRFLMGLEKLGKGDWRGISRTYVTTRTPTQVASHAQKYFLRQASLVKKKRRSSLFDMVGGNNIAENHIDGTCNLSRTSSYEVEAHGDHNALFMIDLNSLSHNELIKTPSRDDDHFSRIFPKNHEKLLWPYGSMSSLKMNSNPSTAGGRDDHISPRPETPPDLELTLAAPNPIDQNKPSPSSFLTGPISVI